MPPGTLVLFAVIGLPPQVAAGGCPIRVVPAGSPGPWADAASALDRELRHAKPGERDCREVEVGADPRAPYVAVVTTDGRRAQRPLGSVAELAPTVEGLLITVPERAPDARADLTQASDLPAVASSGPHLLFAVAGGGRVSFPGTLASTVVDLTGGITLSKWELGLYGTWNPGLPGASSHEAAPSLEFGGAFGRRQRSQVGDVILGARLGALLPSSLAGGTGANTMGQVDDVTVPYAGSWMPTVGAYTALAVRPTSFIRFRPQLLFEWLPTRSSAASGADVPPTLAPSWSLMLGLGAESGAL